VIISIPKLWAIRVLVGVCGVGLLAGCAGQIHNAPDMRVEGNRLMAMKDYQGAAGAFSQATRMDPRDYQSHYYLARCQEELKQYQLAFKSYRTALAISQTNDELGMRPKIIDSYASCVAQHDERDVELNGAEAEARANPTGDNHILLARTFRYRGDHDMAIRAYNQAALADAKSFAIHKEMGLYLLDTLGQTKEAELPLRKAYSLNSQDQEVQAALRRLNLVPAPSVKERDEAGRPMAPKGSLPEVNPLTPRPAGNAGINIRPPRD
jgi:tetratricopeptide (TPR) repeat protein